MALALGRRSLLMKLYIAMGVVTLPLLLLHPLYVLPPCAAQLNKDRDPHAAQVVETAYGVLESYEARVRAGRADHGAGPEPRRRGCYRAALRRATSTSG